MITRRHPLFAGLIAGSVMLGSAATFFVGGTSAYASGLTIDYQPSDSGYSIYSSTIPPATASTNLTVPTVTGCTKADRQIAFGPLVENSSGDGADSFIEVGCKSGKATYAVGALAFSTLTIFATTVRPGDSISLSAAMNATSTTATVDDTTTGFNQTVSGAADTAAYGYVGSFPVYKSGPKPLHVPDFGTVSFTSAEVNGAGIGTYTSATGLYEFIRTTNGKASPKGKVQVDPGTLGSTSFSMAFDHS
jgi:hypothetical protein